MKITINKLFLSIFLSIFCILCGYTQTIDPAKCYRIVNKATNKSLEVRNNSQLTGEQIFQWTTTNTKTNQIWQFKSKGTSTYSIISKSSSKLVDAAECTEGYVTRQFDADGTSSQNWKLEAQSDGSFKFLNESCNKYFGVLSGSTNDGAVVGLKSDGSAESFKWLIQEVSCPVTPTVNLDPNKCYRIVTAQALQVFDVKANSTANGAAINQNSFNGGANQIWYVRKLSDGTFNIYSKNSGKVIDVDNSAGCVDGLKLIQFDLDGTNSQKWRIEPVVDFFDGSYVKIINVSCNKTIKRPGVGIGQQIEIRNSSGIDFLPEYYWRFEEVSCQPNCEYTGSVTVETWGNHTTTNFPLILPTNSPSSVTYIPSLITTSGFNTFKRIRGYLRPQTSGNYVFNISAIQDAEFFLSPNKNSSEKVKLAYSQFQNNTNNTQSNPLALQANATYYFEILYRVGNRLDGKCDLTWKLPNATSFSNIPTQVLVRPCEFQNLSKNYTFAFEARAEGNTAKLHWVTNAGTNTDYFEIQKANTQGQFETLEKKNAHNTEGVQSYTFIDNNPLEGDNFYRINTISQSGVNQYSDFKKVSFNKNDIGIYPNPANDYINIDMKQYEGKAVNIYLYNTLGKVMKTMNIEKASSTPQRIDIQGFTTGQYMIRIQAEGKRDVLRQVIITE
jgi:hypothetical protein